MLRDKLRASTTCSAICKQGRVSGQTDERQSYATGRNSLRWWSAVADIQAQVCAQCCWQATSRVAMRMRVPIADSIMLGCRAQSTSKPMRAGVMHGSDARHSARRDASISIELSKAKGLEARRTAEVRRSAFVCVTCVGYAAEPRAGAALGATLVRSVDRACRRHSALRSCCKPLFRSPMHASRSATT